MEMPKTTDEAVIRVIAMERLLMALLRERESETRLMTGFVAEMEQQRAAAPAAENPAERAINDAALALARAVIASQQRMRPQ